MSRKAFTLIEVLVTMTIITILAGILVPATWKFWESENIATTRERMRAIKIGLVGDKSLVQSGVRTHYGFVGDNGELPFGNNSTSGGLTYLVNKPVGGYPFWNGPYLSGFGNDWNKDAWGKSFRFTPILDAYGRYVSAELRSAGPDGVFDTSDDIVDTDLQISDTEVTPTNRIQFRGDVFGNNSSLKHINALKVSMTFKDPKNPSGMTTAQLCKQLTAASGYANYTTLFESALNPVKLPIGKIQVTATFHTLSDCSDLAPTSNNVVYFISDNINQIILPEIR